ncbi:MAG: 16S rRNA (guanine(966)-N(2))-methyltransferase RsmD [Bacilli bacterium]
MRVISGIYKGRKLSGYNIDGTRPIMDRVKESIFAMINSYTNEAKVLDLFAGSGSLGIEALSNGASSCIFVDMNSVCINHIKNNTKNMPCVTIEKNNYKNVLNKYQDEKFDLIFLDPPYILKIFDDIINFLIEKEMLNEDCIIVCHYDKNPPSEILKLWKEKIYKNKTIKIFKYNA